MLPIIIHPSDELPIYRQIMRQMTEAIVTGKFKAHDKLPSHRELSEQLVIAPLTVKKAYDELEALGFIETERGRGTFVCKSLPKMNRDDQWQQIRQTARQLLSQGYIAGLHLSDIVSILEETAADLPNDPARKEKK
jgi:GntR family transcriptional regulator